MIAETQLPEIQAVIFDMDGLMLDTERVVSALQAWSMTRTVQN
jgi:beta-phosphoglucomutase-like phosphatase (HAD superfamily)